MGPTLKDFEGLWRLERQIEDKLAKQKGTLSGEAVFELAPDDPNRLNYAERGLLLYGDQTPVEATRRYIWQAAENGITVLFDDQRPFHHIEAGLSMPDDMHHCAPDLYHVSYSFVQWPDWKAIWRVVGPRKDYRMTSRYSRE